MANKYTTDRLPKGYEATITGDGIVYYANPGESKTLLGAVSSSASFGPYAEDRLLHMYSDGNDALSFTSAATVADEDNADIDGGTINDTTLTDCTLSACTATDMITLPPLNTYASDGAITTTEQVALLSKATAGAYTLAAASNDGHRIVITSSTAAAHVITFPDEIVYDGTGTPKDTLTFAAQIGASVQLIAVGANWALLSTQNVTASDES